MILFSFSCWNLSSRKTPAVDSNHSTDIVYLDLSCAKEQLFNLNEYINKTHNHDKKTAIKNSIAIRHF